MMLYHFGVPLNKWGLAPIAGWFITEFLISMDDLGGTPFFGNLHFDVGLKPLCMGLDQQRWVHLCVFLVILDFNCLEWD